MKKITLFFTLLFAAFALAQTTLVQYQFEGTTTPAPGTFLNPDPGAVGSPTIALVNPANFNPVSAGNPGKSISTVVDNKSTVRYIKLEISTVNYNSIRISFDHWTNTNNGKSTWKVYANTTGSAYAATDLIGTATPAYLVWNAYNVSLGIKFNNVPKITVYLVAANTTGNTSELRMDNLKITGCKISPPPAPAAPAAQTFCAGATVANLSASVLEGHTLSWYTSGGALLAPGTLLSNGTTYYAVQTDACGKPSAQTPVTATVDPILTANVSISANTGTTVCAGASVIFTATPVNGGTAPSYQWKVNGVNVGSNASTFSTATLINGDVVTVELTSNASPCLTGSPATSNALTMTVNPSPPLTVSQNVFPLGADPCSLDYVKLDTNRSAVFSPVTGLYTDAALTQAYTGNNVTTLYAAPNGTRSYTVSVAAGSCPTNPVSLSLTRNKKVFTGNFGINWSGAGNWFPLGTPTPANCVFIPAGKETQVNISNAVAKNITVLQGGKLSVLANMALTVTEAVTNLGSVTDFVVQSDGNLKQLSTVQGINTGNITVKRNLEFSANRNQYNYLSTPVVFAAGESFKTIYPGVPSTSYPTVLYYVESTRLFGNSSGANILGRSSAVREVTALPAGPVSAEFKGVPYVGDFSYPLAYSNTGAGFNLVGNPYPSNIDLNELYSNNSTQIHSDFRFWDHKANIDAAQQGSGYSGRAYAHYNVLSGTGNPAGYYLDPELILSNKVPNNILKVGQGMMVQAVGTGKSLTFANPGNLKTVDNTDAVFFGKSGTANRFWITLKTPSGIVLTSANVYMAGGSNALGAEDSKVTAGESDSFYTLTEDGERVVINGRKNFSITDVIPVGVRHFTSGTYTIALGAAEGVFAGGQQIYLKDKLTGVVTNLNEGSYTFTANAGENTGRFEIIYKPETILATDAAVKEELAVYKDGNAFVVKSKNKITTIDMYDAGGRLLLEMKPNTSSAEINAASLTAGVYILKITQNGKVTSRKVIR